MTATRMPYLRMKKTMAGAIVSLTIAAVALLTACKGKAPVLQEKQPTRATSETAEVKALRAEVPDVLAQNTIAIGRGTFRESKEAQAKWRTPEELGLALYRSTELLGALGRAENLTSNPAVAQTVRNGVIAEYGARISKSIMGEIPVLDEEIKAYYRDHLPTYYVKGKFSIRQIFLNVVDNPGKEKEKEALAEKALAAINSGTSFVTVAEKYSDNKVKNEIIGPVNCGEINPELEKVILALEPGRHSKVLRTKYGCYIFRLEKVERPTTKTVESVRGEIVAALRDEKAPQWSGIFAAEMEKRYPATKNYEILSDPKAPEDRLVVDSKFFKLTVGDYRKRIQDEFSTPTRESLNIAENRAELLDNLIQSKRIEFAADEMGLPNDPDIQVVKRFVTNMALARTILDGAAAKLTQVSEDEVRKHYEEYHESYATQPELFRLRDITLSYRQPVGTPQYQVHLARQKAKETAQELIAKLKAGAKFEDLARQYSSSPSKKDGGQLGVIDPDRRFNKLRAVLNKMKAGEWTEPMDEGEAIGISIFLLEERKPEVLVPLDDRLMKGLKEVLRAEKRRQLAVDIRVKLAEACHPGMTVDETRKIVDEAVAQAIR